VARALRTSLAGAALTLIALSFDTAPLLVAGAGVTLVGALAALRVALAASGADVRRTLEVDRVHEQQPLQATVAVRVRWPGIPRGAVLDPLASGPIPLAPRARSAQVQLVVRFPRRGRQAIAPPRLELSDPLGLAVRSVRGAGDEQVLVLPRICPVRRNDPARRGANEAGAEAAHRELFAAVDPDGLRPYRPGTPASRIHWAALARGAGLMERRLASDGDPRPLVVLDLRAVGEQQADAAVRAAASLVLELARAPGAGCALLLPGDRRPLSIDADLIAWPDAHVRLALLEGAAAAAAPALRPGHARHPAIFYVCARPPRPLPRELAALARAPVVLVSPPAGRGRPAFEVAGLHGVPLIAGTVAA
jgi:uncharacterized protein (DUF58 family)